MSSLKDLLNATRAELKALQREKVAEDSSVTDARVHSSPAHADPTALGVTRAIRALLQELELFKSSQW